MKSPEGRECNLVSGEACTTVSEDLVGSPTSSSWLFRFVPLFGNGSDLAAESSRQTGCEFPKVSTVPEEERWVS